MLGGTSFASARDLTAAGEQQQSLNGRPFSTNTEAADWDSCTVQGNGHTQPACAAHKGKGCYRREFVAPVSWRGKHVRLAPRSPNDVPSFTLRGDKVKWDGGEIAWSELKPVDPAWTSKKQPKPSRVVKRFTPTDCDVDKTK